MAKTDRELFDAVSKGDELTADDAVTTESEVVIDMDAEPETEAPVEAEADEPEPQKIEEEGEIEAEAEPEADEPEPEVEAQEDEGDPKGVQIPKAQYDRIRGKQKEAEALAEQRAQENAALQGRLEQIERFMAAQQAQVQSQPREQEPAEELLIDPDTQTALSTLGQQVQQELTNQKVRLSMAAARRHYGDDYAKAEAYISEVGTPELAQQIRAHDDPGEAIVQFWKRNQAIQEVGDDPAAYREKVRAEERAAMLEDPAIREELLAELRGSAKPRRSDGSPAIKTAPSLARGSRAADARPQTDDPIEGLSDEAIFANVTRKG